MASSLPGFKRRCTDLIVRLLVSALGQIVARDLKVCMTIRRAANSRMFSNFCKKWRDGCNRYREAMNIMLSGAADQENIDKAVSDGFGRRFNQIGPFQQADFAGVLPFSLSRI